MPGNVHIQWLKPRAEKSEARLRGLQSQRRSALPFLARGLSRWALLLFLCLFASNAAARTRPKVILYLANAPTVRDAFAADAPNLQALIRDGGVAVMTTGPADCDPFVTMRTGRYVHTDEAGSAEPATYPDGVLLLIEPHHDPGMGDRMLGRARSLYPGVPVIAVHPGRWRPEGSERLPGVLSLPSWIVISDRKGRLYGDTTRVAGIVSNLDILPTLQRVTKGRWDRSLPGHPLWGGTIVGEPEHHGLPYHVANAVMLQDSLRAIAFATQPALYIFAVGAVSLLALAGLLLWPGDKRTIQSRDTFRNRARRAVQNGFVVLFLVPAALAIAAGRFPTTAASYAMYALGATAGLSLLAFLGGRLLAVSPEDRYPATLQLASGAAVAYMAADVMRNGYGLKLSPLSSFFVTNVRFYGMGNEYASLFLACAVITGLLTVQRSNAKTMSLGGLVLLGAWLLLACWLVGWPTRGANAGAMLAGLAAGGAAWTLAARRSGVRLVAVYPIVLGAALFGLMLWTDAHSAHATHVGRFVQSAAHGGGFTGMLGSKLAISLRLFRWAGAWVALALAVAIALILRGPLAPVAGRTRRQWPWIALALPALLIGGIVGAFANDSGVIVFFLVAGPALAPLAVLALEPPGLSLLPR